MGNCCNSWGNLFLIPHDTDEESTESTEIETSKDQHVISQPKRE